MQAFHRIRISPSNRNIKKLQKPKPNKYIQKTIFHKIRSKINQYSNIKLKNQGNRMRPLDITLQLISSLTF